MSDTVHRCQRGPRCTDYETDQANPDTKRGKTITVPYGLCDACTRRIVRAVDELPRDYTALELLLGGGGQGLREIVAATPELPAPISLTLASAQAEIVHEAQCWAESVAEVLGIYWDTQAARDSRPGPVLQRATRLLSANVDTLLALPDVVHTCWTYGTWTPLERDGLTGALVLADLHHHARKLTGHTRLINHLPVPCPRCERMALEREDGHDTVSCSACGNAWTFDQYAHLCGILTTRKELV